jgi:ATP-binding cassette, subfamily B (MDR/TAP), member 1
MQAIRNAIERGTTVIMIAHRLSTVLSADNICVLQNGCAVEQGTPSDLANASTVFASLLAAQKTNADTNSRVVDFEELSTEKEDENASSCSKEHLDESHELRHEESNNNPRLRDILLRFLKLTKPEHAMICLGILASIFSGAMIIGESIVFGGLVQLLNTGQDSASFSQQANFYCLMFFILACIALIAYVGSGSAFGIASSRLIARVQSMLLDTALHLDQDWFAHADRSPTALASTFAKDSSDLACLSGVALGTVFTVIVSVCGGIILAHAIAWKIAVVLLSAVPIMVASGFIRLRLLAKSERRHRTAYSAATALAVEVCHGRRTVAMLRLEEHSRQRYHEALQKPYMEGLLPTVACNLFLAFSLAITYFVYALAYWW